MPTTFKRELDAWTDRIRAARPIARALVEREQLLRQKEILAMPEVGGKKLASDFSSMMADVRKSIDESKQAVAEAVADLKSEIVGGAKNAALALRAEAAEVRKGFSEVLGNGGPVSSDSPQSPTDIKKEV